MFKTRVLIRNINACFWRIHPERVSIRLFLAILTRRKLFSSRGRRVFWSSDTYWFNWKRIALPEDNLFWNFFKLDLFCIHEVIFHIKIDAAIQDVIENIFIWEFIKSTECSV